MMKFFYISVFLVIASVTLVGQRQKDDVEVTADIAMKAVARLLSDPPEEELDALTSIITNFALESDNVHIQISVKKLPWLAEDGVATNYPTLLAAYIGGNMQHQLNSGKKEDSPLHGYIAVQKMYKNLKSADDLLSIAILDKWEKMSAEEILKSVE